MLASWWSLRYGTHLLPLRLCVRRAQKNSDFCVPFCLGENCPPAPLLMSDLLLPPCVSLVPFKVLPQWWSSEGVSLNEAVCGFFKRNCLGLQQFLPPTQSPLVFAARNYGDLYSWHWDSGLVGPGFRLGLLAFEILLPNFYPPHLDVGPAHSTSLPLLPVLMDVVS